jgi:hypothetical protein
MTYTLVTLLRPGARGHLLDQLTGDHVCRPIGIC